LLCLREMRKGYDVIHVHDLPLAKVGSWLGSWFRKPFILDLHENYPALLNSTDKWWPHSDHYWRKYEKAMVEKCDMLIVVCEEMKRRFGSGFIVENTPDVDPLKWTCKHDLFTILYIGSITKARGLQYVIRALEGINDVRLVIVGKGKYRNKLIKMADEKTIFLTDTWEIGDADVGIIPHVKSEQTDCSSPNKLFEYMASGLPVIASNCDSVERVIRECKCGITYKYNSVSSLIEAIEILKKGKSFHIDMSINGKKAVETKYNWRESEKELLRIYYIIQEWI